MWREEETCVKDGAGEKPEGSVVFRMNATTEAETTNRKEKLDSIRWKRADVVDENAAGGRLVTMRLN